MAVDIETTGLDARTDEIISIGWVLIDNGAIRLNSARHISVSVEQGVGQSAVFHQIGDEQALQGVSLIEAISAFIEQAKGKILVFHNARLDMAFINQACRRHFGGKLLSQVVDTLVWERQKVLQKYHHVPPDSLRLFHCRRRYNLPDYPAHDALTDALATAELLLAQIRHAAPDTRVAEIVKKAAAF